ncbi:MAG: hypothetical protein ACAI25_01080, partial [Planctomycetota bacterium]
MSSLALVVFLAASLACAEERLRPVEEQRRVTDVAAPSSALAAQETKETKPGDDSKPEPAKGPEERISDLEKSLREAVHAGAGGIRIKAMMDAAFTWNFADPRGRRRDVNALRVPDPDHDSFEVTWAKIGVGRATDGEANEWDAGFLVDFAFGREAQNTISTTPRFLFDEP